MTKDTDTLEKTARPLSKTAKIFRAFEVYEDGLNTREVQIFCGYTEKHGAWKRISELAKSGRIVQKFDENGEPVIRAEHKVYTLPKN
jgi:alpha-beta hydrolase superfamily lysophospholipase